jgi:CTP synthase
MRLDMEMYIKPNSLAYIYGQTAISERHRHRYEYNSAYVEHYKSGIQSIRVNPDTGLVEIVEIEDHPFFYWRAIPSRIQSTVANPLLL